ncbi:hypothetical protein J6590_041092 [Homalodisca vitripennis]|nr:hypothetical protein J6590_041092 [Homalodisca vitripennis]
MRRALKSTTTESEMSNLEHQYAQPGRIVSMVMEISSSLLGAYFRLSSPSGNFTPPGGLTSRSSRCLAVELPSALTHFRIFFCATPTVYGILQGTGSLLAMTNH